MTTHARASPVGHTHYYSMHTARKWTGPSKKTNHGTRGKINSESYRPCQRQYYNVFVTIDIVIIFRLFLFLYTPTRAVKISKSLRFNKKKGTKKWEGSLAVTWSPSPCPPLLFSPSTVLLALSGAKHASLSQVDTDYSTPPTRQLSSLDTRVLLNGIPTTSTAQAGATTRIHTNTETLATPPSNRRLMSNRARRRANGYAMVMPAQT